MAVAPAAVLLLGGASLATGVPFGSPLVRRALPTHNATPSPDAAALPSPSDVPSPNPGLYGLRQMSMFTPSEGWALEERNFGPSNSTSLVVHTSDGGATWKDASPAHLVPLTAVSFLDRNHAWVIAGGEGARSSTPGLDQPIVVWRTVDAAASWTHQLVQVTAGHVLALYMSDANHGTLDIDTLSHPELPGHFVTTDGGATWAPAGLRLPVTSAADACQPDDPTWRTPADGWVFESCANQLLRIEQTHDGGLHWSSQVVAAPPGYAAAVSRTGPLGGHCQSLGTITFIANAFAYVGAVCGFSTGANPPQYAGVYVSIDAGRTWQMRGLPMYGRPHFFTPTLALLLGTAQDYSQVLFRSGDGGRSWSQLAVQPVFITDFNPEFTYLGSTVWAADYGVMANGDPAANTIFRSDDMGQHWTNLHSVFP